jgi:hypothetical protein
VPLLSFLCSFFVAVVLVVVFSILFSLSLSPSFIIFVFILATIDLILSPLSLTHPPNQVDVFFSLTICDKCALLSSHCSLFFALPPSHFLSLVCMCAFGCANWIMLAFLLKGEGIINCNSKRYQHKKLLLVVYFCNGFGF